MRNKLPLWSIQMRDWQIESTEKFLKKIANGKENFLCVATPGAGKTLFALRAAHKLLKDGMIDYVAIVCPTRNLKTQWSRNAIGRKGNIGIDLTPTYSENYQLENYHGFCLTYAQLETAHEIINNFCKKYRVLAIFDEVHHAGAELNWGSFLIKAFVNAEYRLAMSGTPFRSDDCRIPFVQYTDEVSRADFEYTYARAIQEGVCRGVDFYQFDGYFKWEVAKDESGTIKKIAKLSDSMSDETLSECIRMALDPYGQFFKDMFMAADAKLNELRNTINAQAGGLILARDQFHANQIRNVVWDLIEEKLEVIISDDIDAPRNLRKFADSNDKWVIAVKMISEGTDIPRLMVEFYATNIRRELFFAQAVGRVVRMQSGLPPNQSAHVFIPADQRLVTLANNIDEQKVHSLALIDDKDRYVPAGMLDPTEEEIQEEQKRKQLFLEHSEITDVEISEEAARADLGKKGIQTPIPADFLDSGASEEEYRTRNELITQINARVKLLSFTNRIKADEIWVAWFNFGGLELNKMSLKGVKYFNNWLLQNYEVKGI